MDQTTAQTRPSPLTNATCMPIISTTDVHRSMQWYQEKLGLHVLNNNEETVTFECGGTNLFLYHRDQKPQATNTVAGWNVDDLDATVEALRSRGVRFEEYDMPGLKTQNGIATMGDQRTAWFKDPDGNILAVGQMN